MIIGAHVMIQSRDDAADKAFLADVLKFSSVDAGGGFLIFGVPPAEVAVHESERNDVHQLFLMCEDIGDFISEMESHRIAFTTPSHQGWGTLTEITLPGGGKLGVYQPHHTRPKHPAAKRSARKSSAKTPAKKKSRKKVRAKRVVKSRSKRRR
jgi:hypothetical protein